MNPDAQSPSDVDHHALFQFLINRPLFPESLQLRPVPKSKLLGTVVVVYFTFCSPTNSVKAVKDNSIPNWRQHATSWLEKTVHSCVVFNEASLVVNSAQGYLLLFQDKHREQFTNWGSTDSTPQLPTKHLVARFHLQPVHIVVMGTRWLNIYYCCAPNGQQNASVTSVIRLTSQMCSRTMKVWWNSSPLWDMSPTTQIGRCLTGSSWFNNNDNNNLCSTYRTVRILYVAEVSKLVSLSPDVVTV